MNVNTIGTIKHQCQLLLLAIMLAFVAAAQANPSEAEKMLVGSWVRSKGKIGDAKFELLEGGTGTSGSTPITWKYKTGDTLVLTKNIKGKETVETYSIGVNTVNPDYYGYGTQLMLTDSKDKESEYWRKDGLDEIERIKKEAKQSISFTDSRDKKKYKAVKIDGKTWMAENLNFKTDNSLCFGKKDANCTKYGRLYTWDEAKKACPEGWRLPKKEEWVAMFKAERKLRSYNDNSVELANDRDGDFLRAKTGWSTFKGGKNGTNELGFSALPGGSRSGDDFYGQLPGAFKQDYEENSVEGAWWADLDKGANAGSARIGTMKEAAGMYSKARLVAETPSADGETPKTNGLSVRCVQD